MANFGEFTTDSPDKAAEELIRLYTINHEELVTNYQRYVNGKFPSGRAFPKSKIKAVYPKLTIETEQYASEKHKHLPHGYLALPGIYQNTFTRPDLFKEYYLEQLILLCKNHPGLKIGVSLSDNPIPIDFALNETISIDGDMKPGHMERLREFFHFTNMRDFLNPSKFIHSPHNVRDLSWYNGPRTDRSVAQLYHYTGTIAHPFQGYVMFTNYQDYVIEFRKYASKVLSEKPKKGEKPFIALVEPGNNVILNKHVPQAKSFFTKIPNSPYNFIEEKPDVDFVLITQGRLSRRPQFPTYHLVKEDGSGVTIVDYGVGFPNIMTITNHIAKLRPIATRLEGHCAGIPATVQRGDTIVPKGFAFGNMINIPTFDVPELSEMYMSFMKAFSDIHGSPENGGYKKQVRSGNVLTVANRDWEVPETEQDIINLERILDENRITAVEMESAVYAWLANKNGFSHGIDLIASDNPLRGEHKLPGVSQEFYKKNVPQHFLVALHSLFNAHNHGEKIFSRQLRSDYSPRFR